jgi:hypothetical protein
MCVFTEQVEQNVSDNPKVLIDSWMFLTLKKVYFSDLLRLVRSLKDAKKMVEYELIEKKPHRIKFDVISSNYDKVKTNQMKLVE